MKTKFSAFITVIIFLLLGTTIISEAQNVYFKKNGTTVFQSAISGIDSIVFKQDTTNLFFPLNSSDPLLMRRTMNNVIVEYYGEKLDNGIPISLNYIYINDKNNDEQTFLIFENETLKKIILNDGTDFSFNWITQDKAEITLTFPDGLQVLHIEDFGDNFDIAQLRSANQLKSSANDGIVSVSTCGTANDESSVWLNINLQNGENPRKILCTSIGNGKYKFYIPHLEKSNNTVPIDDYCNALSSTTKITKYLPAIVAVICGAEFLIGILGAPETLGGSLAFTVHSFTACPVAMVAALGIYLEEQEIPCPDNYNDYIPSEISVIPEVLFRGKTYYGNTINLQLLNGSIVDASKLNDIKVQAEIPDNELVNIAGEEVKSNEASIYMNIAFNCGDIQGGSIVYSSTNTNPTVDGTSCMLVSYSDGYSPVKIINITNLLPNTEYYVRAFSQTSKGEIIYSTVQKIKTLQEDFLDLSSYEKNFKKEGGVDTFTINTNLTITNISSTQSSWCHVPPNVDDTKIVNITVDPNDTTEPRQATISIDAINPATNKPASKIVLINQEAGEDKDPESVVINGVRWLTRNVGATNPEDYGNYYQWNRGTIDFLSYEDYFNDSICTNATFWLPVNDPCPAGYRVPTIEELQSVYASYVTSEWTTRNGVYGRKFSDSTNGASIFFPAAGFRDNVNGILGLNDGGYYWSSSSVLYTPSDALSMTFGPSDWNHGLAPLRLWRASGCVLRCVAK